MFRTYIFQLQPSKKQALVFNALADYINICHQYFLCLHKDYKTDWLTQLNEVSHMFFAKHRFSHYFINSIFYQLVDNFSKSYNKGSIQSVYPITFKDTSLNSDGSCINFPFIKDIKLSHTRKINGQPLNFKLFYNDSKFSVHLLIKLEQVIKKNNNLAVVGIDMGLESFLTLSTGLSIDNPRFEKRYLDRIRYHQKKLSSKTKNSLAWKKEVKRVNSLHSKVKRLRFNFFHEISNYLISNFDVIGIENLAIRELQSHKQLKMSLKDASWGIFINILEYKCEQNGKHLIRVGRYYPSSQICSFCGNKKIMPLQQRTYECNSCGKHIDRDYNASMNIECRAIELLKGSI